jgi:hypothetical protein
MARAHLRMRVCAWQRKGERDGVGVPLACHCARKSVHCVAPCVQSLRAGGSAHAAIGMAYLLCNIVCNCLDVRVGEVERVGRGLKTQTKGGERGGEGDRRPVCACVRTRACVGGTHVGLERHAAKRCLQVVAPVRRPVPPGAPQPARRHLPP